MQLLPEFLIRIICKKLTYYEWREAHDKWLRAIEKVSKKEDFSSELGFSDLVIIESCSYCKKVKSNCLRCSLFYRNICSASPTLPRLIRWLINESTFWKYVFTMRDTCYFNKKYCDEEGVWTEALSYCQKILTAINKDKPPQ